MKKKLRFMLTMALFVIFNSQFAYGEAAQRKLLDKLKKKVEEKVDKAFSPKNDTKQAKNGNASSTEKPSGQSDEKTTSHQTGPKTVKPVSKKQDPIDLSDVIVYKSPVKSLKDIHIQAHKGLPRIGNHNHYYYKNKYGGQTVQRAKHDMVRFGTMSYEQLLDMKYFKKWFDEMDLSALTVLGYENRTNLKDIHSSVAQKHLFRLASNLSTPETKEKYFCDPNKTRCMSKSLWSGTDEFDAEENYQGFVKENYAALRAWSNELFPDDQQAMYYVVPFKLPQYDFDQGGYWLKVPPIPSQILSNYSSHEAFYWEFLPITDYGNAHLNRTTDRNAYYPHTLFKLSPEKAEALTIRKPESLYLVAKVVVQFKEVDSQSGSIPNVSFTYHLDSPEYEIYENIELTKKVGVLSLINPVYKNQ